MEVQTEDVRTCSVDSEVVLATRTDFGNAPKFTLAGRVFENARVTNVVDGDTLDVEVFFCPCVGFCTLRIRLYGVDTPEMRPKEKDIPDPEIRALHIKYAIRARDAVQEIVFGKNVTVSIKCEDKYGGRYVGQVVVRNGVGDLSQWLIEQEYGIPYDGRKKNGKFAFENSLNV